MVGLEKGHDLWSISNVASLASDIDSFSPGLIENAVNKRYCKSESDFNFRECYSDLIITWGAAGETQGGLLTSHPFVEKGHADHC